MEFHGTTHVIEISAVQVPSNSMELFVSLKLAHSKFHGIPWSCSCQRNWRISSSMEFHGIVRFSKIGALPWNSMEFHGTALVSEIGAFEVPWNSMELLVSAKLAHFKFHGIPWNCLCQRNWRIPNARVSEFGVLQVPLNSMEFHGTARVSEIGALWVPWNSMKFHGTARLIEIGTLQVPWNGMEFFLLFNGTIGIINTLSFKFGYNSVEFEFCKSLSPTYDLLSIFSLYHMHFRHYLLRIKISFIIFQCSLKLIWIKKFHGTFSRVPWNFLNNIWTTPVVPWNFMELKQQNLKFHGIPWNSMEFCPDPKFHGIPRNFSIFLSSMEFHGTFNFPPKKVHGIPSNSMELDKFDIIKIIFLNIVVLNIVWLMIRCYLAKISQKRYILHWFQYRNSYFEHPSVSENGGRSAKMTCCLYCICAYPSLRCNCSNSERNWLNWPIFHKKTQQNVNRVHNYWAGCRACVWLAASITWHILFQYRKALISP